jgi:hypothetical protein
MKLKYTIAALAVTTMAANAAISLSGDSSTFDYLYEMDVDPTTQDQNSGGGNDWFNGTSGGITSPVVSGGFAVSNNATSAELFRGDFGAGGEGSIWRETVSGGAASTWTLEISVANTSSSTGTWFGIATANLAEGNSSAFLIGADRVTVGGVDYMVGTDFNTGAYHDIRIAHDAVDNAYYYWVDGTLLNADLSTAIAGTNGTGFDNNTFIGQYSGSHAGDFSIDYIRLDTDAIAVVPEPSSTALLGLGGLALILRRRK